MKLTLNKESIRLLDVAEQADVYGGRVGNLQGSAMCLTVAGGDCPIE